jgi:hypothetical protein
VVTVVGPETDFADDDDDIVELFDKIAVDIEVVILVVVLVVAVVVVEVDVVVVAEAATSNTQVNS